MNAQQERRWSKLKVTLLGIPLIVIGTLALAPVTVGRAVLDSDGQPTYGADGMDLLETDHWESFKANWFGFSLIYSGIGVSVWGIGGWLIAGFADPSTTESSKME